MLNNSNERKVCSLVALRACINNSLFDDIHNAIVFWQNCEK